MKDLKVGDTIGVRGPLGKSWPVRVAEGKDVIIVTGGIGLAPLRPVIYHMMAHREKFGKIVLLCGTRTPNDLIYRRELEKWRSRLDMEVHITVDRATSSWRGNVGVVTTLIGKAPFDHLKCIAMVCGPEIMMRFTILELQKRGMDTKNIYVSMERNMKCGIGLCGHCQIGSLFVCKDGPSSAMTISKIYSPKENSEMTKTEKPKLAVWKFASCSGCQLSLLDCEDELLAITERLEIAIFRRLPGRS
jgi:NAD(P)H-flavin reductase